MNCSECDAWTDEWGTRHGSRVPKLEDRIAELEAENARLREALEAFVNNSSAQVNLMHECEQAEKALEAGDD